MLVTAFFLQRNGHTTRPVDTYIEHFKDLANLGLPITLYLDRRVTINNLPECVNIIPMNLEETDTFNLMNVPNPRIFVSDNPTKNTHDFHMIMNCKAELLSKTCNSTNVRRVSWVDFGLSHVIGDKKSFEILRRVDELPTGVTVPGCWEQQTRFIDQVSWRFCGGFISADKASVHKFYEANQFVISRLLPRITWEVNVWALTESILGFPYLWYKADHNDSIIDFRKILSTS